MVIYKMVRFWYFSIVVSLLILGSTAGRAVAGEETAWHAPAHSKVRLISATSIKFRKSHVTAAGIEIKLDQGWKTYWRTPVAGFPPVIDWSGSENLAGATLLWPVPRKLSDLGGLTAYGYKKAVIIPLLVKPEDASADIRLNLSLNYGVCDDICIPVELTLSHIIPAGAHGRHRNRLRGALEAVPQKQDRGIYCPHHFITAKRRVVNGKPSIIVKTAFEPGSSGLDLFAEAADGIDLPIPVRQPRASRGRHYYILAFENAEAERALKGQTLRLTMAADQGSCETVWRVP